MGGEWKKAKVIVVQKCVFFALNVDEVTMIDNQKWISMHVYMRKNWVCTPLLLTFQWIEMGATIENIMVIILKNSIKFKGLVEEEFIFWCVCLGRDGDSTFQAIIQALLFKQKIIQFLISSICIAWDTKLTQSLLFCQSYLQYYALRQCCKHYTCFLLITPKNALSFLSL